MMHLEVYKFAEGKHLQPLNFCRHSQAGSVQISCGAGMQRPVWRGSCGFSSPAGPLGSAYRDLCISTHLQNHCGPDPLTNADKPCPASVRTLAFGGHSLVHPFSVPLLCLIFFCIAFYYIYCVLL